MDKEQTAGKAPQMEKLEAGKTYAWCPCKKSSKQPWCDGAHVGTDFKPTVFKATESKTAAICMCKQTGNPPYCDGSHAKLV